MAAIVSGGQRRSAATQSSSFSPPVMNSRVASAEPSLMAERGQHPAGNIGFVAIKGEHAIHQVFNLAQPGPFQHGENAGDERFISRIRQQVESLLDEIAGQLDLIVFVDVEDPLPLHRLAVVDHAIVLPDAPVEFQHGACLRDMPQGQQGAAGAVLVADISHVVDVPGQDAAFHGLLGFDQDGHVIDGLQQPLTLRQGWRQEGGKITPGAGKSPQACRVRSKSSTKGTARADSAQATAWG